MKFCKIGEGELKNHYESIKIGNSYGDWKIIKKGNSKLVGNGKNKKVKKNTWVCQCNCGYCNQEIREVLENNLKNGKSNGCGVKSKYNNKRNKKYNTYDLSGDYGIGYASKGEEFYFDLEDYDKIKDYCWHKHKDGYLRTSAGKDENNKHILILQHRLILDILEYEEYGLEVDHKNRIPHDNRKNNLIIVSHNKNMKNYGVYKNNTSGIIGVSYSEPEGNWKTYIQFNNKRLNLGSFPKKEDAIIARLTREKELYNSINKKPPQLNLITKYRI